MQNKSVHFVIHPHMSSPWQVYIVPMSPRHPGEPFFLSVPCAPFIVFISFCHCCAVVVFVASVDKISCCLLCSHTRGLRGGGKLRTWTFGCLPWPRACLDLVGVVSCLSHICLRYLALDAVSKDSGTGSGVSSVVLGI